MPAGKFIRHGRISAQRYNEIVGITTFFNWVKRYGEDKAIAQMKQRWGEEMPAKGILFAMGTHSLHPDTWLINGIIQMGEMGQLSLGI